MNLSFTVHGPPVPKARARVVKGRAFTPKRTRDYESHVTAVAFAAASRCSKWPKDATYALIVVVWRAANRGDLDNYLKAVSDALNGIAWNDDRQVTRITGRLGIDRLQPRVEVNVEALCG